MAEGDQLDLLDIWIYLNGCGCLPNQVGSKIHVTIERIKCWALAFSLSLVWTLVWKQESVTKFGYAKSLVSWEVYPSQNLQIKANQRWKYETPESISKPSKAPHGGDRNSTEVWTTSKSRLKQERPWGPRTSYLIHGFADALHILGPKSLPRLDRVSRRSFFLSVWIDRFQNRGFQRRREGGRMPGQRHHLQLRQRQTLTQQPCIGRRTD